MISKLARPARNFAKLKGLRAHPVNGTGSWQGPGSICWSFRLRQNFSSDSGPSTSILSTLRARGLISEVTNEKLDQIPKITAYLGADPTAPSLHVGNMVPLMIMLHLHIRGHNSIVVVGGATGQVGDPSGRTTERTQLDSTDRLDNVAKIQHQMAQFLHRGQEYAATKGYNSPGEVTTVNNADWWKDVSMLEFLGTYGRHIRVSQMLGRESVRARLRSDQGIGFNEFTYQVLQAYDFWHLYRHHQCQLQIGGSDQWGNITAGIDLISRLRSDPVRDAFGVTAPLLTTPSGEKFGKSAGNAVWLDATMTRPFDLYQYFVKAPDSVVESYLKMFTLLDLDEVAQLMAQHSQDESVRLAQRRLAQEVTDLVHGGGSGHRAAIISSYLYSDSASAGIGSDSAHTFAQAVAAFEQEGLTIDIDRSQIVSQPWKSVVATVTGVSKSDAGRKIKAGGVYVGRNNEPISGAHVDEKHLDGDLLLLRLGKSSYYIAKLVN